MSQVDEPFHIANHDACRPDLTRCADLFGDDLHDEVGDIHHQNGAGFVVEDAIPHFVPAATVYNDGVVIEPAEGMKIHFGHAMST